MTRIRPAPAAPATRVDEAIHRNVDEFSRAAALDGRIDAARNHHHREFARTAALDGRITSQQRHQLAEFSKQPEPAAGASADMAPRAPLPPPMPEKGFNHPRPATLHPPRQNPRLHPVAHSGPLGVDPRASHLGRLDPGSGVFVGTGKWHGADQPATMPAKRTEPLRPHEYQQTGYQLGVRLASTAPPVAGQPGIEPIEHPADLAHLRAATEVMHRTRTDLMFGRGNVAPDVEATKGESSARTEVSYSLHDLNGPSVMAGVALALGAGNCDQNGRINARRYAPLLGEGETVDTVGNDAYHHTWAQINQAQTHSAKPQAEPRPTIIMDSWADGAAVRLGDSSWAPQAATTLAVERFDKTRGTQELEKMEQARADTATPGGPLHAYATSQLAQHMLNPPGYSAFAATPTVGRPLARKAQEQMMKQSPLTREVMAVAAARQGYELNVAEAARTATSAATLDAAMSLEHPTRPPIFASRPPSS